MAKECVKEELKLVSLFSGGGGLDIGLGAAGFKTLFANDVIPQCCATLEKNLNKEATVVCADIKKVSGADIRKALGLKKDEFVDLLAGGPPCQAFSIFGQRKGRADPRGQMVYEYFRILSELKPKAFVFENVFGLLTVEQGEVYKVVCERLANPCEGLNYDIKAFRLNAVDYLEFTHFLTAKTHLTPMNKGRGAFSQVKWAFVRERVFWRRGSRCRSAEFEVLRASRSAFRRLQQRSASNSSLNPGRNSVSSFPVGPGSGSTVMRRHFPNRVKARLRPSAIA